MYTTLPALVCLNANENIIAYLDHLLQHAIACNASDVHFEIFANHCQIRFRLQGLLTLVTNISHQAASQITARLKILAKIDSSERRLPQDGHFQLLTLSTVIDCRLSTCPTLYGEKCVVRMIYPPPVLALNQLAMRPCQFVYLETMLQQVQGMLLVTGPTGSGKSTTLYAALHYLNKPWRNIFTLEDPVELEITGINQLQINNKIGLHFSTLLPSILRQDPDVIMLGEMRDEISAQIAIKAAQTGHLVLSTLHTGSTFDTLIRLINMGIKTIDIASSVKLIVAQRLVRLLCLACQKNTACTKCHDGYYGRTAIFELLPLDKTLIDMLYSDMSPNLIRQYISSLGLPTLWDAGMDLVNTGRTSLQELHRVLGYA